MPPGNVVPALSILQATGMRSAAVLRFWYLTADTSLIYDRRRKAEVWAFLVSVVRSLFLQSCLDVDVYGSSFSENCVGLLQLDLVLKHRIQQSIFRPSEVTDLSRTCNCRLCKGVEFILVFSSLKLTRRQHCHDADDLRIFMQEDESLTAVLEELISHDLRTMAPT
ncbi:hypothetical protein CVT26_001067 [Gymnopilus dilepis]|uniref:Uncharacterized protein n=1 Tax=Gymnopilus dilepis TaxID=231916 RepID=A0A409WBL4_9AGAR|nr:hypothetical protein CVT26_001067 [Gymnopilus dilepis]